MNKEILNKIVELFVKSNLELIERKAGGTCFECKLCHFHCYNQEDINDISWHYLYCPIKELSDLIKSS